MRLYIKFWIFSAILINSIIKTAESAPYNCNDLGYIFEEGGCLDTSTMIRCPMDLSRVWCIGGEVCGQYPVKGAACNDGAKIESCALTENKPQSDKRCKYENDSCNQCWEKGVRTGDCGTSESCCKEGWDLIDGVCVEHQCDKILYPYDTDNYDYAEYAGNMRICRSGNVIHFGYDGCKDMWQRESHDPTDSGYYKCLCRRTDYDKGYVFPYDKSTFYTGYAKGMYGDNQMCADAEGSYYGYTHCFRGYEMRKDAQGHKLGTCEIIFSTYCNSSARYSGNNGNAFPDASVIAANGYKCVYDDICTETNQNYEECNVCVSADATLGGTIEPYAKICSYGSTRNLGFISCPYSDQSFVGSSVGGFYGTCYGSCLWGDKNCRMYDMVLKDNQPIGVVFRKYNNSAYAVVAYTPAKPYNKDNNGGWNGAMLMAAEYTPKSGNCEIGSGCEAGKWHLPDSVDSGWMTGVQYVHIESVFHYYSRYKQSDTEDVSYNLPIWTSTESGENALQHHQWDYGYINKNTPNTVYAYPIVTMEVK